MKDEGNLYYSWLLDTGATDHITFLRNIFINFQKIKPIKIRLLNGWYAHANNAGTVRITKNLIIYDVFYISSFTLNIFQFRNLSIIPISSTYFSMINVR